MHLELDQSIEKILKAIPNKVSMVLDNYDEIFSDFDPRELSERRISDDFIEELKKMSSEKEILQFEITMRLPEEKRNIKAEQTIINRLNIFFKINFNREKKLKSNFKKKGIKLLLSGLTLLFAAGYLSKFQSSITILRILFVVTEPAGWYFAWTGFEKIFDSYEKTEEQFTFYMKMSKSKFHFESGNSSAFTPEKG